MMPAGPVSSYSHWCDGRDSGRRLRALLALVLGQRDVFRFDDLEDVGIVEDEVLQPLA